MLRTVKGGSVTGFQQEVCWGPVGVCHLVMVPLDLWGLIIFYSVHSSLFIWETDPSPFHVGLVGIIQYLFLHDWLIPLSLMSSGFIHIVVCVRHPFLFKAPSCSIVWIYHILLIHSFIEGYLGCFHLLAIVNNAAMNISVQTSLQDPAFSFWVYTQKWNCWIIW